MKNDVRICFFGDSYIVGVGDETALGWCGRLIKKLNHEKNEITYYNLGVRGNTSLNIKNRWVEESKIRLSDQHQNYIIFSYGTNDTNVVNGIQRVKIDDTIYATEIILAQSLKYAKVLLIGPPPALEKKHNKRILELDNLMFESASKLNIEYISLYKLLENNSLWINEIKNNDSYHPTSKGYDLMCEVISKSNFWSYNNLI